MAFVTVKCYIGDNLELNLCNYAYLGGTITCLTDERRRGIRDRPFLPLLEDEGVGIRLRGVVGVREDTGREAVGGSSVMSGEEELIRRCRDEVVEYDDIDLGELT